MLLGMLFGKPIIFMEGDGKGSGGGSGSDESAWQKLIREREDENYKLRREKRELTDEVAELKEKQPPEGAIILQGDDAKEYQAFKALGKKPEELGQAVADAAAGKALSEKAEAQKVYADAAEPYGWKPGVLATLPSLQGKKLEVRSTTENGKTVKKAYVKDGATETELSEFVQKNDSDYIPALPAQPSANQQQNQQQQNNGATWLHQANSSGNGGGSYVNDMIKNMNAEREGRENPLVPATKK